MNANLGGSLDVTLAGNSGRANTNSTRDTAQQSASASVRGQNTVLRPAVNLNVGIAATIEKHILPRRDLSPFIGFGMYANVYSANDTRLTFENTTSNDTGDVDISRNVFFSYYTTNSQNQRYETEQIITTRTVVGVGANLRAGVEYFVLPALSLTAEAIVSGGVDGIFFANSVTEQNSGTTNYNAQSGYSPPRTTNFYTGNSQRLDPTFTAGISVGISASVTVSYYFGRNALGDILNAFKSGTLFQW